MINHELPDAHLFRVEVMPIELEDISHVLYQGKAPEGILERKKKILSMKYAPYTLIR